jgi:bifunctional ADP-heptose synthase (sugar kinase/adenylyltransferase)
MSNILKPDRIIVMVGAFNPLSLTDVMQIRRAKTQGDWIIIGVNSDFYIKEYLKQEIKEIYEVRRNRMKAIKSVDEVFTFNDTDGTAIHLLSLVQIIYPGAEIFFVTSDEGVTVIPETAVKGVRFLNVRPQ